MNSSQLSRQWAGIPHTGAVLDTDQHATRDDRVVTNQSIQLLSPPDSNGVKAQLLLEVPQASTCLGITGIW